MLHPRKILCCPVVPSRYAARVSSSLPERKAETHLPIRPTLGMAYPALDGVIAF